MCLVLSSNAVHGPRKRVMFRWGSREAGMRPPPPDLGSGW